MIELDDSSHKGKEAADKQRDEMLTSAGYKVLRYPQIPDRDKLAFDLADATRPMKALGTKPASQRQGREEPKM